MSLMGITEQQATDSANITELVEGYSRQYQEQENMI